MSVAIGVTGFAVGMLVGAAIAYPRGWKAGFAWAAAQLYGRF